MCVHRIDLIFNMIRMAHGWFNSAVCVSLEEFINIDVSLCWATLPVIMSPGQKTWRHARPHDLLLCCGRIQNIRKCSLNAIIRRAQDFRKHIFYTSKMENLLSVNLNQWKDLLIHIVPKCPNIPSKLMLAFLYLCCSSDWVSQSSAWGNLPGRSQQLQSPLSEPRPRLSQLPVWPCLHQSCPGYWNLYLLSLKFQKGTTKSGRSAV